MHGGRGVLVGPAASLLTIGSSSSDDWGRVVGAWAAKLVCGLLHDFRELRWERAVALGQLQLGVVLKPCNWLVCISLGEAESPGFTSPVRYLNLPVLCFLLAAYLGPYTCPVAGSEGCLQTRPCAISRRSHAITSQKSLSNLGATWTLATAWISPSPINCNSTRTSLHDLGRSAQRCSCLDTSPGA